MEYREIYRTGMKVSNLSFGASLIREIFHAVKQEEDRMHAVYTWIENAINLIETFPYYGHVRAKIVLAKSLNI